MKNEIDYQYKLETSRRVYCPACMQGQGRPWVVLGDFEWYRCRDCGLDFAKKVNDEQASVGGKRKNER